jgi:hypothetical protein
MPTTEERFEAAVTAVQAQGVHFRLNVMSCCNGCATASHVGLTEEALETTPHAWNLGSQDNELVWQDGEPRFLNEMVEDDDEDDEYESFGRRRHAYTREADVLWLNHGGPGLKAAQALTEAFRGQGFTVEWNGTDSEAVQVHLS